MADKQESVVAPILMTVVVIIAIVVGTVILSKAFDLPERLFSIFRGLGEDQPKGPTRQLPIARGPDETIELSQMAELRQMLEDERFEDLNALLGRYQEAFESNPANEMALIDAYQSFYVTMPHYDLLLEKWIKASSRDYQPYLAAGHYYYAKGWQSRGFKWRRDTSDEQISGMVLNFEKARQKLETALEINPSLMPAFNILIGIHNAGGSDQDEEQTIEKAIALFPASYNIRSTAMWACQPRWGGSYRKMWRVANGAEPYADDYPVLTSLYGAIFCEKARVYESNKENGRALAFYNKAVAYGDRDYYFRERAEFYAFKMKDAANALNDINYAISLRPTSSKSYLVRAKIHFYNEDFDAARQDLRLVHAVHPEDPATARWCRWASRKLTNKGHQQFKAEQLHDALNLYEAAMTFYGDNVESNYWHGVVNYRLEQYADAMHDFKRCIDIDAHYFNAYRMLDYTLAKEQQWDAILSYWNAFLELEPDHAEAYLERSGTHYHKLNLRQAKADLQKACSLGSQKACQLYEKRKNEL